METTEITRLQNEIVRLNSIIDALITENNLLKRDIALHNFFNGNTNGEIACQNSMIGNTDDEIANDSSMIGNTNSMNAFHSFMKGNTDIENALHNSLNENTNDEITNHNSMKGNVDSEIAIYRTMTGNTNNGKAFPTSMKGNTKLQEGNTINTKPGMHHWRILTKHLDKILHVRTPKSGKQHTALLLLHFYNSNLGSHTELMKVTGMKLGGLTKQLANLKKRGWLVRSGWQQFALTDVAKKMVEEGVLK